MAKSPEEQGVSFFFDLHEATLEVVDRTRAEFQLRIHELLEERGASAADAGRLGAELWEHMANPERHYHSPVHVLLVLAQVRKLQLELPPDCQLAVWFHDIIYDPRARPGLNEDLSADWVAEHLPAAGIDRREAERAAESIRWTGRFLEPEVPAEHGLVLDIDLAGLSRPRECFERQSLAVRQEQGHLTDEEYRLVNLKLFEILLARQGIYRTAEFGPLEPAARANLERACAGMRG